MNRKRDFNFKQLIELIIIDASLMTGNDFFTGIQTGTGCFNDVFSRSPGISKSLIAQNNTQFVFIEDQSEIDRFFGVGIFDDV